MGLAAAVERQSRFFVIFGKNKVWIKGLADSGQGGLLVINLNYMDNEKPSDLHDKLIDIELAKSSNSSSAVRMFLPAIVLMASFYYSFLLALGLALGYLGSKVFSKYFLENGKVDAIYINCGKWKIHMHHWILGAMILAVVWVIDYFYLPRFFLGAVCGIIAHDIYDYND
jgi:hypothetical protein